MIPEPGRTPDVTGDVQLAERLRARRVALGRGQEETATAAGISMSYLSRIERGARVPTPDVLARLAAALETTVDELRTGVEPEQAKKVALDLRYAQLALRSGEAAEAADTFARIVAEPAAVAVAAARHEARYGLGQALEALGRLEDAVVELEELRRELAPNAPMWFDVSIAICRCYREAGDLSRAIDVGEQALARLAELGLEDTEGGIRLAVTLLAAYHERGDVLRATQLARSAVERADRGGTPRARASAYWNASQVLAARGALPEALGYADRAVALLSEVAAGRDLARLRVAYARLLTRDEGDAARALSVLVAAREALAGGDGSAVDIAACDVEEARALLAIGALDDASSAVNRAIDELGENPRLELAAALVTQGRICEARGAVTEAQAAYRRAAGVLAVFGASRRAAATWVELAELHLAVGDVDDAVTAYRAATTCLGAMPTPKAVTAPTSAG